MTDSLREQLIARMEALADAYATTEGAPTPDALRRVYADEVIRQMQWARWEGMDGDREKPFDVTPAPPDWTP